MTSSIAPASVPIDSSTAGTGDVLTSTIAHEADVIGHSGKGGEASASMMTPSIAVTGHFPADFPLLGLFPAGI